MGKIRIHELAKELDVPSKDILDFLTKEGVEASNHMSSIDDADAARARDRFAKKAQPEKKAAAPQGEKKAAGKAQPVKKADAAEPAEKKAGADAQGEKKPRPKKKASIAAVYNPQHSKDGNRRQKSIVHDAANQKRERKPQAKTQIETVVGPDGKTLRRRVVTRNGKPVHQSEDTLRRTIVRTAPDGTKKVYRKRVEPAEQKPEAKQEAVEKETVLRPEETAAPVVKKEAPVQAKGEEHVEKTKTAEKPVQKAAPSDHGNTGDRKPAKRGGKGSDNRAKGQKEKVENQNQKAKGGKNEGAASGNEERGRGKKGKKQEFDKKKGAPKQQERYVNLEKKTGHKKKNAGPKQTPERDKNEILTIKLPEYLTVRDLADKMKIQPSEIIKKLFMQGTILTLNQEIDYEKAEEIALEFNCIAEPEEKVDVIAELLKEDEEDESKMVPRPPVVCVMGHVDHGKTSLLDAIRETHVTDREAGGITQHIGASVAKINGNKITFLDTPGHEAFTAMRMRGANSTDLAILVVAADDGIMPQTIEAINHAKAAGIEIIVAINKIDKPNANIDFVKQGLSEHELIPEDWGGSTICVPVSAKTREGIDQLLEMVLLTAEMLELKANPKRKARGLVIEAKLDKGRGAVATALIQKGTLKVGQPVAAGSSYGKVRAMTDHTGKRVKEAGPSTPVEIIGLNSVPGAGEVLMAFDSEKDARSFAETFVSQDKEKLLDETRARMNLDNIFSQIQAGDLKELNLIVKADVQGSVEAVKTSLEKLSNEEVVVKVIHGGVGAISESDVTLAAASNAVIIGFNVKPDNTAKSIAEGENVDIHLYSVIYKAIEDVENAMKGMLEPIYEERVIGHAEIRQLFKASGVGTIAGSYVLDGVFERDCMVRITREGEQIYEGNLASLKRFKDDVKEVRAGFECGLVFENFNEIAELDQVEAYKMVEVPRQ
ncbi:MAG: translation initiation factor IF-2 [Eubacterium sp.]|nr:translation initiation factor IF-2 [Eubacterium sp.]